MQLLSICYQKTFESTANPHKHWFFTILQLFKLGVFFVDINYFYLSFMQIHTIFYFNYINYSGLLIFCCQNVATSKKHFNLLYYLLSSAIPVILVSFFHTHLLILGFYFLYYHIEFVYFAATLYHDILIQYLLQFSYVA